MTSVGKLPTNTSSEQYLFYFMPHLSNFDIWVRSFHNMNSSKLSYVLKLFLEPGDCLFLDLSRRLEPADSFFDNVRGVFTAVGPIHTSANFCANCGKLRFTPKPSIAGRSLNGLTQKWWGSFFLFFFLFSPSKFNTFFLISSYGLSSFFSWSWLLEIQALFNSSPAPGTSSQTY